MSERHKDILIVDDEEKFTANMAERLGKRGFTVHTVNQSEKAIRQVRLYDYDVVLLDLKMPGMSGEEVLKHVKKHSPTSQVIILTGHGSLESASETGKLGTFGYLEKTVAFEDLLGEIEAAKRHRTSVLTRHDEIAEPRPTLMTRLMGVTNHRPLFIIIGFAIFLGLVLMPAPDSLVELLGAAKSGELGERIAGYAYYRDMAAGGTIAAQYGKQAKLVKKEGGDLSVQKAAFKAKVMIALLLLAAFFWATGAIPIGFTAILVGVVMYGFQIMPPEQVAKSFVKDSVLFIFGVLAMSVGIAKTGLDRRIGALLLGLSSSMKRFLFIFCPLFAVTASFISEHALVAFIAPIMVAVYAASIRSAGVKEDKALAVTLLLIVTLVGNIGGPGSPSAGGRNAIMLAILSDYTRPPSYLEWVKYGLPFVPVMALTIGLYFFLVMHRHFKVKQLNIAEIARKESQRLGPMLLNEYLMAGILLLVVVGWITLSDVYGMAGPVLLGLVLMSVLRIVRWQDVSHINWDVVGLYASATAMGAGLAMTGAALYIADSFISLLPDFMTRGTGLAITCSFLTAAVTNFMSDGAAVSAIGPITVPMAILADTHPWMVGFATAFSSSFAHALIIGTPNNAIVYAVAVDPETGERLVTLKDFAKHGFAVLALSLLVLWVWIFTIYWPWITFPAH